MIVTRTAELQILKEFYVLSFMVCEQDFTSGEWTSNFSVQQYHLEGLLKKQVGGPTCHF